MDDEVLGYKDLAAIPRDKAILDIERPDLMIYEPHFTYSLLDHVERPSSREVRPARQREASFKAGQTPDAPRDPTPVQVLGLRSSPTRPPSDVAVHPIGGVEDGRAIAPLPNLQARFPQWSEQRNHEGC